MTFAATSRSETLRAVEYARVGSHSLLMDIHIPEGKGPFPAAIVVHGGGWIGGDRARNVGPLLETLDKAGIAWFSISYRLLGDLAAGTKMNIPELLKMGTAIDDVRSAIKFVNDNAVYYRIDPARVALIGESAGAQLASVAGMKPPAGMGVSAVVAFYGPSDLGQLAETSPRVPDEWRQKLKGTPWAEMILAGLRAASPISYVKPNMPPFLLIHGTADTLVPFAQSEAFCVKIQSAGSSCDLIPVEGGGHGMLWWESAKLTSYKPALINWLHQQWSDADPAHPLSSGRAGSSVDH